MLSTFYKQVEYISRRTEQYTIPPTQMNGGALSPVFNSVCPSHNASANGSYMHSLSAF